MTAKKKKRAAEIELPPWLPSAAFTRLVDRDDGRRLGVVVQPAEGGLWRVLALETATAATAEEILDAHAHQIVGEYPIGEAFLAADSYTLAWMNKHKAASLAACDCGPIG